MIGVRLNGRLGNQMFQYALAYSLERKYHCHFIIDNDFKEDAVKKYFKTSPLVNNKYARKLFMKFIAPRLSMVTQNNGEPTGAILPLLGDQKFYYGFFQSELYFTNISRELKKYFQVKPEITKAFSEKYGHLFAKKVLAIHYRLGDYLSWGSEEMGGVDMSLPESFYLDALKQITDLQDYIIILVTDDAQNAAHKLPALINKIIISDTEIMDLQLLMNADKLIVSNSSFAWWGAYLNKKNAAVFAPEYWLGFKVGRELPNAVIPGLFTKIKVY